MKVTNASSKTKPATEKPRHLHIPVTADFLGRVNIAAAMAVMSVRDYVITTLEADMNKKGKR